MSLKHRGIKVASHTEWQPSSHSRERLWVDESLRQGARHSLHLAGDRLTRLVPPGRWRDDAGVE